MPQAFKFFNEIVPNVPMIAIIEIGSNPNEHHTSPPTYQPLMARGNAHVTGFEPGAQQFEALQKQNRSNETYLPYAIGDGTTQTFYECRLGVMSSLYEPNHELLKHFYLLDEAAQVVDSYPIETKRLDAIPEIKACDYMHLDVQGAELQCLQGGENLLKNTVVVQAESLVVQMYKKQPLFSEVEIFLRSKGFMFHRLNDLRTRTWRPLCVNGNVYEGWAQWMWADAIFLRDILTWRSMASDALLKMAMIMHDCYRALDLVQLILITHDEMYQTAHGHAYFDWLKRDVPQLVTAPRSVGG